MKKSTKANQLPKFVHFDDFGDILENESDRGCILIANHVLDLALEHMLRTEFSRRQVVLKKAINPLFEPTRPLSSFSAKIQLAYSLRLLDDWAFEDLNRIRQLRNKLAHSFRIASFSQPSVEALVHQLHSTPIGLGYPRRRWSLAKSKQHAIALAKQWDKSQGWVFSTWAFISCTGILRRERLIAELSGIPRNAPHNSLDRSGTKAVMGNE
jgi:DNA-binding MltR family transcriptional regulator